MTMKENKYRFHMGTALPLQIKKIQDHGTLLVGLFNHSVPPCMYVR